MGSLVAKTVLEQPDMKLACGFDPSAVSSTVTIDAGPVAPLFTDLRAAIKATRPDCIVDFSLPHAVAANIKVAMAEGTDCIVGTTGLTAADLEAIKPNIPAGTTLFIAPNFTIGAVLMMRFAAEAARYFPDAEIIELHHNRKADAPSGTAIATAEMMSAARAQAGVQSLAPGDETELEGHRGARGDLVGSVRVHAIRSDAFMASQEVVLGSPGQKLVLRHDSHDRNAYMPGVMLAIRKMGSTSGLIVGLEKLMA
jgi:4-hydroxy-tetrahydrodipicolinate reductase